MGCKAPGGAGGSPQAAPHHVQLPRGRVELGPPNPERGRQPSPSPSVAPRVKAGDGKRRAAHPRPLLPARAPWGPGPRRPPLPGPSAPQPLKSLGSGGGRRLLPSAQLLSGAILASAAPGDGGRALPPLPLAEPRHPQGTGESAAAALCGAGSRSEPPAVRGGRAGGAAPSPLGAPAGCLLLLRGSAAE